IVMTRLPGQSIIIWEPAPKLFAQFDNPSAPYLETARLMGALHQFDWRPGLNTWEEPTHLQRELERWSRLLRHTEDPHAVASAQHVAARLEQTLPAEAAIGLVHGDLQPGNVLFERGAARGLIDWDLAAIGPTDLDVGWLLMMADPESWAPDWRP